MQRRRYYFFAVLIISLAMGCNAQKIKHMETSEIKTLGYSDGNGNFYKITRDSIMYKPVSKEMSSSGIYSGGEAAQKKITAEDFKTIQEQFVTIFKNKKIHITQRMKTSGMLIITYSNLTEKKIIIKKSEEMEQLELLLAELLEIN